MEGCMQGVPENNPALRSNVFSPSTWRCEDRGGGVFKLWEAACSHACLPGQTQSFFLFSFLITPSFLCSAWPLKPVSSFWLLVLSALVLVSGHFVCLCACVIAKHWQRIPLSVLLCRAHMALSKTRFCILVSEEYLDKNFCVSHVVMLWQGCSVPALFWRVCLVCLRQESS